MRPEAFIPKCALVHPVIITFFCGICLEQNLGPDRTQIRKKIEALMRLIRGKG